MNKELELFLYEMPIDFLQEEEIYYLFFPEDLIQYIKNKLAEGNFKYGFKFTKLNNKIKSLFPQIISLQISEAVKNEMPWIIAKQKIPLEQIKYIYEEYLKIYTDLKDKFKMEDVIWKKGKIKDIKGDLYQLVPSVIAHGLSEKVDHLVLGDRTIPMTFYPITFNGVNECISEPIRQTEKDDYFSYVLQFRLVTRGGEGIPRLSVGTGIRRYLQKPFTKRGKLFQDYKRKGSVLLGVKNPFINSGNIDISFSQLKTKQALKKDEGFSKWEDGEESLFSDVLFGRKIKSDSIFENPGSYIIGEDDVRAFIVYSHQMYAEYYSTKVKSGMGLEERFKLFNLVDENFSDLRRLPRSTYVAKTIKGKGENNRLPLITPSGITKVLLEVWGSIELFHKVTTVLSTKEIDDKTLVFEGNRLFLEADKSVEIEIVHKDPTGIIYELEVEQYGVKAFQNYVAKLANKVRKEDSIDQVVLALVEIDNLKGKDFDHKQATRVGLARAGRLSQFIHPLENAGADEERILNGVMDLLSDAGFLRNNWSAFESDGTIMSLSLIKNKKEFVPVITRIIDHDVQMKLLGIEEWLTPQNALLKAENAKGLFKDNKNNTTNKDRLRRFLVENMKETLNNFNQKLYLLLDATLRYGWMEQMSNPKLEIGRIPFFDNQLTNDKRIEVVRINTTDDVPQYRIIKGENDDGVNKESGLFRDPKGIYYSVGLRPSTWKTQRNEFTKYNQQKKQLLQQRAVEIIPLGESEEKTRDEIAYMIDRLRKMNLTYEKHTEQPYPIHKAMAIRKYFVENDIFDYVDEFEDDVLI